MKEIEISTQNLTSENTPLLKKPTSKNPSKTKKVLIFASIFLIIYLLSHTTLTPSHPNPSSHTATKSLTPAPKEVNHPRFKESSIKLPYSFRNLKHKIFYQKLINGVEWIHINDPSTETCSAGIGISSGSFEETVGGFYPGMAHLLEHSFFLVETMADRSLLKAWNAYTASQKTNFMFSCKKDSFLKAFSNKWDEITLFKATKEVLGEVSAVNNEYEMDKNNDNWKVILALSLLNDKTHPASKFTVGSTKTLAHKNTPEMINKFYQKFYSLDKVKVVSYCNNPTSEAYLNAMSILLRINRKMKDTTEPQKTFKKPNIEKTRLVLVKSTLPQTVLFRKYLDLEDSSDSEYHEFFLITLDRYLEEHLIKETHLAESVSSNIDCVKNYAEYTIEIILSIEGAKNLQKIIDVFNKVSYVVGQFLTKKDFDRVKQDRLNQFHLLDKSNNAYNLINDFLANLQDYGPEKLISGGLLFLKNFNEKKIMKIKEKFYEEKMFIVVVADFAYSPPEEEYTDDADPIKHANLIGGHTEKVLLNERLSDYQFLGEGKVEKGAVTLHYKHPEHGVIFGYLDISGKISNSFTGNLDFKPNDFKVSEATLEATQEKSSNVQKLVKTSESFYVKFNTKFALPSLSFFVAIYPDQKEIGKSTGMDLGLISMVWNRRLKLYNNDLIKYKSSVIFIPKQRFIILNVDTVIDNLQKIIEILENEIFAKKELMNKEELHFALDAQYKSLQHVNSVIGQGFSVFSDFVMKDYVLNSNETITYLRSLKDSQIKISKNKFKIGEFYLEGYVNDKITSFIKENLLHKIQTDYNPKINFDKTPYSVKIQGFKSSITTVIKFKKKDLADPNEIYSHVYWLGQVSNLKLLANAMVLSKIVHDEAFNYLRTKKKLGYVVSFKKKTIAKQLFLMLLVGTTEPELAKIEVENFYRLMDGYVERMPMMRFNQVKATTGLDLVQEKNTLYQEAMENWGYFEEDLDFDFKKNLLNELYVGVKKQTVLQMLKKLLTFKSNRKIIIDSELLKEEAEYDVFKKYNPKEVFRVVEMPN